tara:strand:+ start:1359 stop:1625 length:267 start_codon:yes stop_codon:yes gene_type:complete
MQLTDYQFVFIPKWEIKGHEDYYFTSLKELYNSKTNRIVKQVVKGGYSTGYVIDGKFKTLKKLNPLISKIELNPGIVFQIDRILNPNT